MDGGKTVLEKALKDFLKECEEKLDQGILVPYTAYEITAKNLLDQVSKPRVVEQVKDKEEDGFGIFSEINRKVS